MPAAGSTGGWGREIRGGNLRKKWGSPRKKTASAKDAIDDDVWTGAASVRWKMDTRTRWCRASKNQVLIFCQKKEFYTRGILERRGPRE